MKKISFILIIFTSFSALKSNAQTMSPRDSAQSRLEQKRQADSSRDALRKMAIKKKQDSLQNILELRRLARLKKADSIREVRLKIRAEERRRNREHQLRKKERQRFRDSIEAASKRAAEARKAYKKKQKKKKRRKKIASKDKTQEKIKKEPTRIVTQKKRKKVVTTEEKKDDKKKKKKKRKKRRKEIPIVTKKENKKKKTARTPKKKKRKKRRKEIGIVTKKKEEKKESKKSIKEKEQGTKKTISKLKKNKKTDSIATGTKKRKLSTYKNEEVAPVYPKRIKIKSPPNEKSTFFTFTLGQSGYLGDLGGGSNFDNSLFSDLNFKENTFFYGLALSHIRKEAIGLRFSYVFGSVAGSDKNTFFTDQNDPSYNRYVRNLDFRSTINEGSLMLEVYPFKFLSYQKRLHNSYFQPYVMFGVGRFSFNPQGSIYDPILEEDVWIDLQPLQLEGQGMTEHPDRLPYKTTQWNVLYGAGVQYEISNTVSTGIEYKGRILNTDYLDDVSTQYIDPDLYNKYLTPENAELAKLLNNKSRLIDANRTYRPGQIRGNAQNNDFYFSIVAKLTIRLNRNKKKSILLYKYDDSEICE